jgi:SAM-dependent methyltransferase
MSSRKYKHVQIPGSEDANLADVPESEGTFISEEPVEKFEVEPKDLEMEYEAGNELPETRKERKFFDHASIFFNDASNRRKMKYVALVASGLAIILIVWSTTRKKDNANPVKFEPEAPLFVCPYNAEIARPRTDDYVPYYELLNKEHTDVTKYKEWRGADGVDKTYEDRKAHLTDWKAAEFASLKSGDMIYESATGLGTNLALTLEILAETKKIKNLKIYGNDMIESSTKRAKELFTKNQIAGATVGEFCRADSTHLFHVPSNTFHLAFSGYLDPLDDPLGFGDEIAETKYDQLCELGNDASEYGKDVKRLAQKEQEKWFSFWISELIRITKPGGTIVVEDIGVPYCKDRDDWGGVTRDWWYEARDIYGWSVEEESIKIQSSTEAPDNEGRYHVSMKKVTDLE